ncbi:prephenate dehydratase domain-containing protein [Gardnerella leopoldii]|jgi:prephenate dehydratase|uniref:prephenate dehydratase domain-containing protein n=1 Tax=Gardnerella TaxID=2701 RepID=UPI0039708E4C
MNGNKNSQSARKLCYLGPEGSFTHHASLKVQEQCQSFDNLRLIPTACENVLSIASEIEEHHHWGVIAWENNIEGVVIPNLDLLIDAKNMVGIARIGVDISFDAVVCKSDSIDNCSTIVAHPHALAQCRKFSQERGLQEKTASSNAAACRDLVPGEVALCPKICADLYNRQIVSEAVEDFSGARTEFLVLAPRDQALNFVNTQRENFSSFSSIIAFIPRSTGAGVLANLLDVVRDHGLNMTSFMSRPIKGQDGLYSFIATVDAAPWDSTCKAMIQEVVEHGDWVRVLAVYSSDKRKNPVMNDWMLPHGGVCVEPSVDALRNLNVMRAERELLW